MGVREAAIKAAVFVLVGISAIIVGAFMLRGTMRMWDRKNDDQLRSGTDQP